MYRSEAGRGDQMEGGRQSEPVPEVAIGDPMEREVQRELHIDNRKHPDYCGERKDAFEPLRHRSSILASNGRVATIGVLS